MLFTLQKTEKNAYSDNGTGVIDFFFTLIESQIQNQNNLHRCGAYDATQ